MLFNCFNRECERTRLRYRLFPYIARKSTAGNANVYVHVHEKSKGFTLIEILVVMLIISIVTTVALLSIRRNETKEMETLAKNISQMVTFAEEQAMLQSRVLGVAIQSQQLQFASLENSKDNKKTIWHALNDHSLGTYKVPNNVQMTISSGNSKTDIDNDAKELKPQIIISTNGDIIPFTIYLGIKGKKPQYAITGDADGYISTKHVAS